RGGLGVRLVQRIALARGPPLPRRLGLVSQADAGLLGEPLDSLHEVQVLDLTEELDGVPARAAPEAEVQAFRRRDGERRTLVRVERTDPHHGVVAGLLQRQVAGDELDDVGPLPDRLDVLLPDPPGHAPHRLLAGVRAQGKEWVAGQGYR